MKRKVKRDGWRTDNKQRQVSTVRNCGFCSHLHKNTTWKQKKWADLIHWGKDQCQKKSGKLYLQCRVIPLPNVPVLTCTKSIGLSHEWTWSTVNSFDGPGHFSPYKCYLWMNFFHKTTPDITERRQTLSFHILQINENKMSCSVLSLVAS